APVDHAPPKPAFLCVESCSLPQSFAFHLPLSTTPVPRYRGFLPLRLCTCSCQSQITNSQSRPSEFAAIPVLQLVEERPGAAGGDHRAARVLDLAAHQQQAHAAGVDRVVDHFAKA